MGEPRGALASLSWRQEGSEEAPRLVFDGHLREERDLEGLRVPAGTVIFDFAELRGIDRGGVRALLNLARRLRIDQSVVVERCPEAIAEILQGNPALAMRLPIESTLEGSAVPEPSKPHVHPERKAERHRVHLQVRYRTAHEFVREYAENLSRGGLFIQTTDVAVGSDVEVELELPGRGTHLVRGVVRNVLTDEASLVDDARTGAGIELTDAPPEFQDALSGYLAHLGRRRDASVLATTHPVRNYIEQFGYNGSPIQLPGDLMTLIARADHAVVGVIVNRREEAAFREAAREHGVDELIVSVEYVEEIDAHIPTFDERLPL